MGGIGSGSPRRIFYKWDSSKDIQGNADSNGISFYAMNSYKHNRKLKCAKYIQRRKRTFTKQLAIDCLYKAGFNYSEIAMLFKEHSSNIHKHKQNYIESRLI